MCPPPELLSAHQGQFWWVTAIEFVPLPATVVTVSFTQAWPSQPHCTDVWDRFHSACVLTGRREI